MWNNGSTQPADLVLAGGGVKGIGHVGAISVLEEHDYEFQRIAGTSAGAIVGSLAAAGFNTRELLDTIAAMDFRTFRDTGMLQKLSGPLLGGGLGLLLENGVFEGDAVRDWIADELAKKDVYTFRDLKLKADPESSLAPNEAYKLVVMATDITRGELIRLPWDYDRYGLDRDEQLVCDAVRASISIPYFFKPVTIPFHGIPSTVVDGGVMSNFPIDTFDRIDAIEPRWPTFGVTLIPNLPLGNADLLPVLGLLKHGPIDFTETLVTTMIVGHDQTQLAKPWIAARAIPVDTNAVGVVDFGITEVQQQGLYENGRRAAGQFLETWDWAQYRARFRGASPVPSPVPSGV